MKENMKGVEFKVEVTNVCKDGACKFCSPMFRPMVKEAKSNIWLKSFKNHLCEYLSLGGRKVILTGGGEPLDAPAKLFGALSIIKDVTNQMGVTLELLTVYTNGVNLLKPINPKKEEREDGTWTKTALDLLVEHGVTDINISISGFTKEQRTKITGPQMGSLDIDALITRIVDTGIRVMVRSTLTSMGISTLEHIEKFTQRMANLGVNIVYFSDMFNVPKRGPNTTPGDLRVLHWTDRHRIDFVSLVESVQTSSKFEFVSQSARHKSQGMTYEFVHRQSGIKVLFGSLNIGNEPEGKTVYYYMKPDGSCGGTNNRDQKRDYISLKEYLKYRPGRED